MKTEFDIEIISELDAEIKKNEVVICEEPQYYIKLIEKHYPFVYSGIDWTKVNNLDFIDIKNVELEKRENLIVNFLKNIYEQDYNRLNEKVVIIGDYETNLGYEMSYSLFLKKYKLFFNLPQDTYIWFIKSEKCINYTFEDELYFA